MLFENGSNRVCPIKSNFNPHLYFIIKIFIFFLFKKTIRVTFITLFNYKYCAIRKKLYSRGSKIAHQKIPFTLFTPGLAIAILRKYYIGCWDTVSREKMEEKMKFRCIGIFFPFLQALKLLP